jgi:hypothetical protein
MKELKDDRILVGLASSSEHPDRLRVLDLAAIAEQLNSIAAELRSGQTFGLRLVRGNREAKQTSARQNPQAARDRPEPASDVDRRRAVFAEFAREAYATRRRRSTIFKNAELFGEPAWDILLDLYIAHVENKPVSVSSACIGSAAPPTTGLRWLGVLAENGLVIREHDPEDQRRVLVRLTESGLSAMDEYFAGAGLSA